MKLVSQMTEEELKTFCRSVNKEYAKNSCITLKQSDFDNMWKTIGKQFDQIERLQEQLNEANEVIANFRTYDFTRNDELAEEYQVKYGIVGNKIYTNRKPPKEFECWRKKTTKSLEKKLKSGV